MWPELQQLHAQERARIEEEARLLPREAEAQERARTAHGVAQRLIDTELEQVRLEDEAVAEEARVVGERRDVVRRKVAVTLDPARLLRASQKCTADQGAELVQELRIVHDTIKEKADALSACHSKLDESAVQQHIQDKAQKFVKDKIKEAVLDGLGLTEEQKKTVNFMWKYRNGFDLSGDAPMEEVNTFITDLKKLKKDVDKEQAGSARNSPADAAFTEWSTALKQLGMQSKDMVVQIQLQAQAHEALREQSNADFATAGHFEDELEAEDAADEESQRAAAAQQAVPVESPQQLEPVQLAQPPPAVQPPQPVQPAITVMIPHGSVQGQQMQVQTTSGPMMFTVPPHAVPGSMIQMLLPAPAPVPAPVPALVPAPASAPVPAPGTEKAEISLSGCWS
eukprot:g2772.t1